MRTLRILLHELHEGDARRETTAMARALRGLGHLVETEEEGLASSWDVLLVSPPYSALARPVDARLIGLWPHSPPAAREKPALAMALAKASFVILSDGGLRDELESAFPGVSRLALPAPPEPHSRDALAALWTESFLDLLGRQRRPRISAVLLATDDSPLLRAACERAAPAVDEIVLGVDASAPTTIKIAESMGFEWAAPSRRPPGPRTMVPLVFRDFSQARNELAAHATGDYLLWLDGDEALMGAGSLRQWIDRNRYYEGFRIERRRASVDSTLPPDRPVRCFRREGLRWFGCVGETVGRAPDRPPEPLFQIPEVFLIHIGQAHRDLRRAKLAGRDLPLLIRDRRENPGRAAGLLLGMRQYLEIAGIELEEAGGAMTAKAWRCLNRGFEIWEANRRHPGLAADPEAFEVSREILKILAEHGQPLRRTGTIPLWAEVTLGGIPLGLETSLSTYFATFEEYEEHVRAGLAKVENHLRTLQASLPPEPIGLDQAPGAEHVELPPELFGL